MTEKHLPLFPCPFCGSSAHITEEDGLFFAGCDECFCAVGEAYDGCAMPKHCFFEEEAAAEAWNTRAVNGLPEAIAALEDLHQKAGAVATWLNNWDVPFAAEDEWRGATGDGQLFFDALNNAAAALTKLKG